MGPRPILAAFEEISQRWFWFLILGVALIVLGAFSIAQAWLATLASIVLFAWILIIGGIAEVVAAFGARKSSGLFQHLLFGFLSVVAGALLLNNPAMSAAGLTLLLAAFFLLRGVSRIIGAAILRYPSWGWSILDGVVTLFLGILIWREWPGSAIWVIGTFVGIDLISRGLAWVMFALGARRISKLRNATA